jgi:hypothetical protein
VRTFSQLNGDNAQGPNIAADIVLAVVIGVTQDNL